MEMLVRGGKGQPAHTVTFGFIGGAIEALAELGHCLRRAIATLPKWGETPQPPSNSQVRNILCPQSVPRNIWRAYWGRPTRSNYLF